MTTAAPTCYRHPDRTTYVQCTRCQRYICPECMRDASVGHQCAECVSAGAEAVRQPKARSGGRWGPTRPVLTYVLIAINVVAFVIQMASPRLEAAFVMWSPAVANGELYRMLTSAFLHSGITHILFNMFALFVVGPPLEIWLGRLRFIALYLLSAIGGSVLIYLFSPLNVPTLGASGAVFGLFAATFVVGRKVNVDIRWVVIMIVINLVITFTVPSISWQGHLGGLVTGGLVAYAYAYAPAKARVQVEVGATVAILALFAVLVWWRTSYLLALV
jgi:membrane associated rhomboid family serine protease